MFEPKKQDVTWMTFFFFPIPDLELGSWIRLPGPHAPWPTAYLVPDPLTSLFPATCCACHSLFSPWRLTTVHLWRDSRFPEPALCSFLALCGCWPALPSSPDLPGQSCGMGLCDSTSRPSCRDLSPAALTPLLIWGNWCTRLGNDAGKGRGISGRR